MLIKWIVTTIHEPFPVNFAHVNFPSEANRATAKGPFYSAPVKSYLPYTTKNLAYAEWSANGLRERGWTVTVTECYA